MRAAVCSIENCNRPVRARGWCKLHYQRWSRAGDPVTVRSTWDTRARRVVTACAVEGCNAVAATRGWCHKHYYRWKTHGDPRTVTRVQRRGIPPLARFMNSFDVAAGGCWEWKHKVGSNGYAHFSVKGKDHLAHRWIYKLLVGPISPGLTLDHLCRVRHCVNPAHLEPVTPKENSQRAIRDLCPQGHLKEGVWAHSGHRYCKVCRKAYEQRRRAA